ncbi:DUF5617 domain-containing protein [Legionella parisiensis]|uniref:RavJ-like C-terminal domain-containing protein n=1 Tax=Legionella parisiensis TaxID=45071 RepID=A0A1E5JT18_9GAMM|nr:DUF5617 domain-containing protein [Legionella parisiensis]KTD40339.1 substrate of the Dot/Icm secretion system [Legionella parisiensis]OEH47676.1 hypothetical protein lpari_01351 [Legionella parisiensis]STX77228.1 Dot/Icm secretion system substrate [Legionella parisiensis]
MSHNSSSIVTMISEDLELINEEANDSVSYDSHSCFPSVDVKLYSFFNRSKSILNFPDAYANIWNKTRGGSNHRRIEALLIDYTKENCLFGSFIGRMISGHWNRHHVSAVSKIIANISVKNYYDCADDILSDLKTLKPGKGGSLYQRIKFIEKKLEDQLKYNFKF